MTIFIILPIVALVVWQVRSRKAKERTRAVGAVAAANHWTFGATDVHGCGKTPFNVFKVGGGRRSGNVCSLAVPGESTLYLFDHQYTEGGGSSNRTYKQSCALFEGHNRFPLLTISHESVATSVLNAIGAEDLQFESEEFNRTFRVRSHDPRFASAIIDARMMEFLLGHQTNTLQISVQDKYALMWCDQLAAEDIPAFAQLATEFWAHIPPVARELYPGT